MPDPTLEQVLLQRAQHIGPDPMAGSITDYPEAKIGMMGAMGTPGKLTGLLKGVTEPAENRAADAVVNHIAGWLGMQGDPSAIGVAEEMIRLAQAKAAGGIVDMGKKANSAWRDYTGHNLIPTPHGVINKLLGTNYGNDEPQR